MSPETKLTFNAEAIKAMIARSVSVEGMVVEKVNLTTKSVPSGDRGEYSETVVTAEAVLRNK